MLSKIGSWITRFSIAISRIMSIAILSLLAIFITVHIIVRSFGVATKGYYEITLLIIVALVLAGIAYTQSRKGHITLDFLTSRFSPKARGVVNSFTLFLGLVFSALFIWQLVIYTQSLYVSGSMQLGMVPLPWWPAYVVACLAFILFLIVVIAQFIQSIRQNIANFRRSPKS